MSGPKVDYAELRRQEMERLSSARRRRLSVADRIERYINQIGTCLGNNVDLMMQDASLRSSCEKIQGLQQEYLKELKKLLDTVRDGNELLDTDSILKESEVLVRKFNESIQGELELVNKLATSSQQFKQLEAERQQMGNAKRKKITRISMDSEPDSITQEDLTEQSELFEEEIKEQMTSGELTSKHKNTILLLHHDLQEIMNSDIALDKKSKRIKRLYDDYEKMSAMMKSEVEGMKAIYDEYRKECFDLSETPKRISEFSSIKEIKEAITDAKEAAEGMLSKEYIKRQIDEVMAKHGYDVVRSDLLEEVNQNGQILYGVDKDSAIDVFVSNDNQVTMRVVGIGFNSQISGEENEKLFQQQCAFCSIHPQITAELAMRGVILHTKKHMPPDRMFNKKIQTKTKGDTQTVSRAKKELKRTETKVMYKE